MPSVEPTIHGPRTDGSAAPGCAACPHPLANHDRIAMRFCTATTSEKHDRGCVCSTGG